MQRQMRLVEPNFLIGEKLGVLCLLLPGAPENFHPEFAQPPSTFRCNSNDPASGFSLRRDKRVRIVCTDKVAIDSRRTCFVFLFVILKQLVVHAICDACHIVCITTTLVTTSSDELVNESCCLIT